MEVLDDHWGETWEGMRSNGCIVQTVLAGESARTRIIRAPPPMDGDNE